MEEELSLGTFEPSHAQYPYLNSPRSLEACRIHGVRPVELVAIPYEEFRKGFPNDDDAARRRFERIDGARKRIFATVLTEWDRICSEEKVEKLKSSSQPKETIIEVSSEARSTLLEIQAEKFRKLEFDHWTMLQRKINLSIQAAFAEQQNKKIIDSQNAIEKANSDTKKFRQQQREELFRQQLEAQKRKEEERMIEVRKAQEFEAEESYKLERRRAKEKADEKTRREKMETDRRQREEYTKTLKETIYKDMEKQIAQKEKIQKKKEEEFQARLKAEKKLREKEIEVKRQVLANRAVSAKEKMERELEEKAALIKKQVDEDTQRVQKLREIALSKPKDDELRKKVERAKKQSEEVLNERIQKTKAEMELRESLARQELEKAKIEQERRRNIKLIRQEAFELASSRRKKADDYKEAKLLKTLQDKDDRYRAIQTGYKRLEDMRREMHEAVAKTAHAFRDEVHNLQHKDQLSPDAVAQKALDVSQRILFPELKAKFKISKKKTDNVHDEISSPLPPDSRVSTGFASWDQFLSSSEALDVQGDGKTGGNLSRATTAPVLSSIATAKSVSPGKIATTAKHDSDLKGSLSLKFISPESFVSAVSSSKIKIEKASATSDAAEAERRQSSAATTRRPGSTSKKDTAADVLILRSLSKQENPIAADTAMSDLPEFGMNVFTEGPEGKEDSIPLPQTSGKMKLKPLTSKGKESLISPKATFLPVGTDEFRREFSADHPLAMGRGKYEEEKKMGKTPASGAKVQKSNPSEILVSFEARDTSNEIDTRRELEVLRRKQNEILLRILEDEKRAEEERMGALRATTDQESRNNLELIFAEERKRASERIIKQTKENEAVIKQAMLAAAMHA